MAETKVELMFDGILQECVLKEDRNNELLYVADDGQFVKFPVTVDLEEAIENHNDANSKEVEVIEDVSYGDVTTFDSEGNEVK